MSLPTRAAAQNGHAVPAESVPPVESVARAVRAPDGAIRIDGVLDESAWNDAPAITTFRQRDPDQGAPATEPSAVRVLFTDGALYVGFRAWDDPEGVRAVLTRRDEDSPSDWVVVAIDSYLDRRTAFVFAVNPAGVKLDFMLSDDDRRDDSWDAVWDAAVARDDTGWSVEFRIPFSQLRFASGTPHRVGFQLVRFIRRLAEEDHWRLMPKDEPGVVSQFGDLVGLDGIDPGRRLEALPYVAGTATREANGASIGRRAGVDVTAGLPSNLTLSATLNPDFGQVEADPAVVNLTAFETFFPERRPFFVEGLDLFRFSISLDEDANEELFYTRRIGRAPQGSADARGGSADPPGETRILGAAKLTGKTRRGLSIGLLGAVTAQESAPVVDSAGMPFRDVVEPRTGYAVARLARDFRDGGTQLRAFGTAVLRDLPPNLAWLRRSAYTGGFGWTHRFAHDAYAFQGWLAGSSVQGAPPALVQTQRSPTHYFQRPDAAYVHFDSTRTSLAGVAAQVRLTRIAGASLWSLGAATRSPGFEVNDAGYQRDGDHTTPYGWLSHRWLEPGRLFRRVEAEASVWGTWSYGGERTETAGYLSVWLQLANLWEVRVATEQSLSALDARALRGGPAIVRPYEFRLAAEVHSDERRAFRGQIGGRASGQPASGRWSYQVTPQLAWRPASNVDLSAGPSFSRQHDTWQYLVTASAAGSAHYVFGDLRQTTAALELRASVAMAPALSLQAWAEPFVSAGDYGSYRVAADPRAARFADRLVTLSPDRVDEDNGHTALDLDGDGIADVAGESPDFTYLSLRANLVLRWEYAPGSTLFLVWQHTRDAREALGTFDLTRGIADLWSLDGANTLVLKLNYWLAF